MPKLKHFVVLMQENRALRGSTKAELYGLPDRLPNLAERTYRRRLRELLDKEVIFRSPVEGVFFVNIRCMFNGDRLAFVKAYHLKGVRLPGGIRTRSTEGGRSMSIQIFTDAPGGYVEIKTSEVVSAIAGEGPTMYAPGSAVGIS